jgi:hypothetical protein
MSKECDSDDAGALDWNVIGELKQLRQPGGADVFGELVRLFMTELDIRLPMFEAHSLKGSSQQMGAIKLSALCLRMEISGRGNTIVDEGLLAEAEREALRVRKALQAAARI